MKNENFVDKGGEYNFDTELLEKAFEEAKRIYKERGF